MSFDPSSTCTASSSPSTSPRLTAGVVTFLARRAMTTHHRPAAAPPFLHSRAPPRLADQRHGALLPPPPRPATPPRCRPTPATPTKLLLNVLSRHQAPQHEAAMVAAALKRRHH
ncbi:hypothetical protein ZWY2020_031736 [Hordeum vulgare]|nr:hypothetical protein ZWY2020_031736 [Hordeum vulgare]